MAIIKYNLVNGQKPLYITSPFGSWRDDRDDTRIGIGSGGGTILTKDELLARALDIHANSNFPYTYDVLETNTSSSNFGNGLAARNKTNAEVTTMMNDWCTAKGIS